MELHPKEAEVIENLKKVIAHIESGNYPKVMCAEFPDHIDDLTRSTELVTDIKVALSYPWPG